MMKARAEFARRNGRRDIGIAVEIARLLEQSVGREAKRRGVLGVEGEGRVVVHRGQRRMRGAWRRRSSHGLNQRFGTKRRAAGSAKNAAVAPVRSTAISSTWHRCSWT